MEEIVRKLEDLLELEEGELTFETVLDDVEEWDSISKLALMAEAKRNYGKQLTADDIKTFETVEDICKYLKAE